ncbi:MAG TPA: hypothetical protein VI895_02550 [Bdellovibrionota bacterium]|nr:hypothetical protein [Bdellovibrionota bacterium]
MGPCGCATENLGGLARRAAFVRGERGRGVPLLLVDSGDDLSYAPIATLPVHLRKEADRSAQLISRIYESLQYDAILRGEADIFDGRGFGSPEFDRSPALRIVERSGWRVAIFGFGSPNLFPRFDENWRAEIAKIRPKVDLVLVLAHIAETEISGIAKVLKRGDIVILGHTGKHLDDPILRKDVLFFEADYRGQFVGKLQLHLESDKLSTKNQIDRLRLEDDLRFSEEPAARKQIEERIKSLGPRPKSWYANELVPLSERVSPDREILKQVESVTRKN